MSNDIPSQNQWGPVNDWDLDLRDAFERFAGKSLQEVLPYFYDAVLLATENLRFMPSIPFRYYIFAFQKFLLSDDVLNDDTGRIDTADAASAFLHLLHDKLVDSPKDLLPIIDQLMPTVEYVATHQNQYQAPGEIYGSFSSLVSEIKQLYASQQRN
jgi:hypothetical protein